jgi:tRNA U54 and U55 pseudouridine synthase Pus10
VKSKFVSCTDLKIVDKVFFDHLKEIESSKAKSYAAVVCSKEPFTQADADILNKINDLTLN